MLTITSNEQAEKLIKDGVLAVNDDIKLECDLDIEATIKCLNLYANDYNINAWNIITWDIAVKDVYAWNITAWKINAWNIDCRDITCEDIDCWNIDCRDITCGDITCGDITCKELLYYAFCCVYNSITCTKWKGRRDNAHDPICLDGELIIKTEPEEMTVEQVCEELGRTIKIVK